MATQTWEEKNAATNQPLSAVPETAGLGVPPVEFATESADIAKVRKDYESARDVISTQLQGIVDMDFGEDNTGKTLGQLNSMFDQYKGRVVQSAMASVKKASGDLETYLSSPGGDQRSSARGLVASKVKSQMMESAYKAVGDVYSKHADQIIQATATNTQQVAAKAGAIASLIDSGTKLFGTASNVIEQNYEARLNASIQWAIADQKARTESNQMALAAQQSQLEANLKLLGMKGLLGAEGKGRAIAAGAATLGGGALTFEEEEYLDYSGVGRFGFPTSETRYTATTTPSTGSGIFGNI